jgi:cytochrome c oxidase subunit II
MRGKWRAWVADRFGLAPVRENFLKRRVPRDPWYFGDGATLLLLLMVQVVTGAVLALSYTPTPDAAYASVEQITDGQPFGRFLRGLHYWSAGLMVIMLFFHLFRQVLVGGYKFPREGTWLIGVGLFFAVLVMAFTGYVLRWDERAVHAVRVVLHMFYQVPVIGEALVYFVQGGPAIDGPTLTRFYGVHVIFIPLVLLALAAYHVYLVVLHGTTSPSERSRAIHSEQEQRTLYEQDSNSTERGECFYPHTAARSGRMAIVVFVLVLVLTLALGPPRLDAQANLVEPSFPVEEWWFAWYSAGGGGRPSAGAGDAAHGAAVCRSRAVPRLSQEAAGSAGCDRLHRAPDLPYRAAAPLAVDRLALGGSAPCARRVHAHRRGRAGPPALRDLRMQHLSRRGRPRTARGNGPGRAAPADVTRGASRLHRSAAGGRANASVRWPPHRAAARPARPLRPRRPDIPPGAAMNPKLHSLAAGPAAMSADQTVDYAQSMLHPAGPAAESIAWLWWVMCIGLSAVFIGVVVMLLVAICRPARRGRSEPPGGGIRFIIAGGVVVPSIAVFVMLLASLSTTASLSLAERGAGNAMTIEVVGHQWWWEVRYPTQGIITANEIHLPVGTAVRLELRAADVIHSLWIPSLHGKMDMFPEKTTILWISADRPGTFRGQCAEFCGRQHARMALVVVALPAEEFDGWVTQRQQAQRPADDTVGSRGLEAFMRAGCQECHAIRGTQAAGRIGPDLTHIGSRLTLGAGTLPNTHGGLAGWIANPQAIKPGSRMPRTYVTADELHAITDYLRMLQ